MCDSFVILPNASDNGRGVIFGKNSDREAEEPQFIRKFPRRVYDDDTSLKTTYLTIPQAQQVHSVLISQPSWMWGAEMGANEHGLVIGNEATFSKIPADSSKTGLIGMDLVRLALERAVDVDEGIDVITRLLRRYGQSGNCGFKHPLAYQNSFLICDTSGAAILETVERDWVARPVKQAEALSNVMTIHKDYTQCSVSIFKAAIEDSDQPSRSILDFSEAFRSEKSDQITSGLLRIERMTSLLQHKEPRTDLAAAFAALRDHGSKKYANKRPSDAICLHDFNSPLGHTTGSWVSELRKDQNVHWVTATPAPCVSVFKPMMIDLALPDNGNPNTGQLRDASCSNSSWHRHAVMVKSLFDVGGSEGTCAAHIKQLESEARAMEQQFLGQAQNKFMSAGDGSAPRRQEIVNKCWSDTEKLYESWYRRLAIN